MPATPERKALAAAALASGMSVAEAAAAAGVNRSTLWKWEQTDPEFARLREAARTEIITHGVTAAVAGIRRLAPKAIKALERGLDSNARFQLGPDGKPVALPDDSLAVRSAGLVLDRIPELARRQKLEVTGTLEARLVELDAEGERESD